LDWTARSSWFKLYETVLLHENREIGCFLLTVRDDARQAQEKYTFSSTSEGWAANFVSFASKEIAREKPGPRRQCKRCGVIYTDADNHIRAWYLLLLSLSLPPSL
jgi:hypothetical protein